MTIKQRTRLSQLNAIVTSIDRVISFGLQYLQQTTTNDLKELRDKINKEQQTLMSDSESSVY